MKKSLKIFGMLFFTVALLASCDNDNDPADDNLFVGQYQGTVGYSDPDSDTSISTDDGQVTVVKVGNSYTFNFSNGIPSIKDIVMEKNQNSLISSDKAINIDADSVDIIMTKDGKTWTANCSR